MPMERAGLSEEASRGFDRLCPVWLGNRSDHWDGSCRLELVLTQSWPEKLVWFQPFLPLSLSTWRFGFSDKLGSLGVAIASQLGVVH